MTWLTAALREVDLWFLSNWKKCDRGDSFPFDYEPTEFRLVHNRKENWIYVLSLSNEIS